MKQTLWWTTLVNKMDLGERWWHHWNIDWWLDHCDRWRVHVFRFFFPLILEKKEDCGKWSTCIPTSPVTIRMDFPLADCAMELILVKCLFGCRSSEGAGDSVCQINTFTDEARNDLITLSQYTCVWEVGGASGGSGGESRRRAGEDKQSVKSLNHTHYWGISAGPGS